MDASLHITVVAVSSGYCYFVCAGSALVFSDFSSLAGRIFVSSPCLRSCFDVFCDCSVSGCIDKVLHDTMDDIVDLETSHCPSTQLPTNADCDFGTVFLDTRTPSSPVAATGRGGGRSGGGRTSSAPSQTQPAAAHKGRGPNWTEAEMLVLIEQKRIEWDGRHNSNQPSLAKFVYGTAAWRLVLAGCMSVVGFRPRDADQITNKWDGLIKDYKKLKEYIEGTGAANWWGLSREEKKDLSRTRKMPLEFSEPMYIEMEGFVGKRQIFGRATDVVDSDRLGSAVPRSFGRSPPTPRSSSFGGATSPSASVATAPQSSRAATPGDDTPGSTGRKHKASGSENLVDFVKEFNNDYLACVQAQEKDKRAWRTEVFAFDTAREARIAHKESHAAHMDDKLYNLEVERTKNLGNMTSALLMLASSMDALTRLCFLLFSMICAWFVRHVPPLCLDM